MSTTRAPFSPEQFTTLDGGHGATKLSTSAVAPLVAAARGYQSVFAEPEDDHLDVRAAMTSYRLGSLNSSHARKLRANVGDSDAMMMPWYRMDEVSASASRNDVGRYTSLQMRPEHPVMSETGKPRKYDMFAGTATELDVHPATPYAFFKAPSTVFFTEGLMKGDSALTGMLRAAGVSDVDLATVPDGKNREDTRRLSAIKLRELMDGVPEEQRFLIVSFVGVGNWKNRPEWAVAPLKGPDVWIAYDADASVNLNVWKQAQQLTEFLEMRKVKSVHLLDLGKISDQAAEQKAGIDDFLADLGRWEDLPGALTNLPPRPAGKDEAPVGTLRVHPDGVGVQRAESDGEGGIRWSEVSPIGGRVVSEETVRQPRPSEMETGQVNQVDERNEDVYVNVETRWKNKHGDIEVANVTGPAIILGYPPKDWDRKGAHIPSNLLRHPEWPPEKGAEWLRAVKSNDPESTEQVVRWRAMGWVPTSAGEPAYICGNTVVTSAGVTDLPGIVGVTEEVLSGASSFGVAKTDEDVDWKEQAADDLRAVFDTYIKSKVWTDPRISSTILGIALRPALPVRPRVVAYFVGARRSGKSYSAGQMMQFWQPTPGTWGGDHLPGSAKDTIASMEHSVAHSNIWISDDLAPSVDRNQAAREEDNMGSLIRAIHNNASKRRMNADGTSRTLHNPRAVLVVTAENEQSVSSVSDRVITVHFGDGVLGTQQATDDLVEMGMYGSEPARLAQAFIRWHLEKATEFGGWANLHEYVLEERVNCGLLATEIIKAASEDSKKKAGDPTRHASLASDAMITLVMLGEFARDIGADKDIIEALELPNMPTHIAEQVANAYDDQSGTSPGYRILQAVSNLLSSGKGHIGNLSDPNSPPVPDGDHAEFLNLRMGWTREANGWRRQGPQLGWSVLAPDRVTEVVILDQDVAFNEAQRAFPNLIPHGQKSNTAWQNAWEENLCLPEGPNGWTRQRRGNNRPRPSVRVTVGGAGVVGVPVLRDFLTSGLETPDRD